MESGMKDAFYTFFLFLAASIYWYYVEHLPHATSDFASIYILAGGIGVFIGDFIRRKKGKKIIPRSDKGFAIENILGTLFLTSLYFVVYTYLKTIQAPFMAYLGAILLLCIALVLQFRAMVKQIRFLKKQEKQGKNTAIRNRAQKSG